MTRRHIHYEAAFEDYLRSRGIPYVAVDEQRRAIFAGARVKSFDFLIYHCDQTKWLVDVKGRKFPYESADGQKRYWENWVTREDVEGLDAWQGTFGEGFLGVFVFAYLLSGPENRWPDGCLHNFANEFYSFVPIRLDDYRDYCNQRSPSWGTVTLPAAQFRELAGKLAFPQ